MPKRFSPFIILLLFLPASVSAFSRIVHDNFYATPYSSIDRIVETGIVNKYYPGAQLLIGNKEKVIYQKSYGKFTYDEGSNKVEDDDLFDIASLTKVVATTPSVMKLYEDGKIHLNDKVSTHIPEFANNGKESITILNLLLHNSGLKSWIPFHQLYSSRAEVLNAIYNIYLESPVGMGYKYSDLNMIILGDIVERVSGKNLDEFSKENIFRPLGMNNTTYNPSDDFMHKVLPTEFDSYWRKRLLKGEVHDESAAMLGGISGNAGLFSNAEDIYKYMNMILNKGTFSLFNKSENKIFEASTIQIVTEKPFVPYYINTRTIGWDTKPISNSSRFRIPCGDLISSNCIGHTGYTGTSIWADLDRDLVIIFLTNRVYPSRDNLGIMEIRPELHDEVIRVLGNN
jgi:CubicO group peptidase (beta-lactamase class C family)